MFFEAADGNVLLIESRQRAETLSTRRRATGALTRAGGQAQRVARPIRVPVVVEVHVDVAPGARRRSRGAPAANPGRDPHGGTPAAARHGTPQPAAAPDAQMLGAAALTAARAESVSCSMATSPIERMPTARPAFTTGRRRMARALSRRTAVPI